MARLVKQFRFYGADNAKNYPEVCTYQALAAGNIFKNYSPVTQLGIQADPGFKFYLNNSDDPIQVGDTGIYELDLEGLGTISRIRVSKNTLDSITEGNPIMIDIIYEGASS